MRAVKKLARIVSRFQGRKTRLAEGASAQMREVARLGQTLVVMELR